MHEEDNTIIVRQEKNVLIVKFNRPEKKNAYTRGMYARMTQILNDAATNEEIVVVVLTGEGDFYSSGNDLSGRKDATRSESTSTNVKNTPKDNLLRSMVEAYIDFPKILIALVNGPAIGIAATTLALCDLVYASDKAYFTTPFTQLGIVSEACSSYTFPKILGCKKAAEMLLFNQKMTSLEALNFGFVNELFTPEEIKTKAWQRIFHFASLPRESLFSSKQLMRKIDLDILHSTNKRECDELEKRIKSDEFKRIAGSFAKKRGSKI